MTSLVFQPDTYYELRSNVLIFSGNDVENWKIKTEFKLTRGEIVLCTEIIPMRNGAQGRGRYARLVHRQDEHEWVLYHRLSRLDRGQGQWNEVNPMIVLALADRLPTL